MSIFKRIKKRGWMIKAIIESSLAEKRSLIKGVLNRKEYYPKKKVNATIKDLIYCALCPNMCRFECPVVEATKNESHSPATKARIAYYLEMNRLEKTTENILPLFEGCLHCSACQPWCPFDFAVGDLLEGVAIDLFEAKKLPEKLAVFSKRIRDFNGLYPKERLQSEKLLSKLTEGNIYYFPGCVSLGNNSKVIRGIISIAEKAGIKLKCNLDEKMCCGAPVYNLGDIEEAKELARNNYNHIKDSKVEAIVCECPECVHTLKVMYAKLGFKFKIPIYHFSEWVSLLLEEGKIDLKSGERLKRYSSNSPISYHDPCVLSRKLGITEEPYQILSQIFPENFKEVSYAKETTHCCGFGGLVNIVNHDIANKIALNRLLEFKEDGIETIVTSCPTCWYGFMKNNPEFHFEIVDLVEIVADCIVKK